MAVVQVIEVGNRHDRRYIAEKLAPLPFRFRARVIADYAAVFQDKGRAAANESLWPLDDIPATAWRLSASDSELVSFSQRQAKRCGLLAAGAGARARAVCGGIAERVGIEPPEGPEITEAGAVARLGCDLWWRRNVRREHGRAVEGMAVKVGLVHRRAGLYCSDESLHRRKEQKTRNRQMLEEMQAVNELGQEYTLAELADLSVSNPTIRRGELMTRIAGFELLADRLGHVGEFYTFTCPSRMHARHHKGGAKNARYDGTTPREAQKYLQQVWARIRAALHRRNISVYGFRVAEPQHDGTPHWHLLLFMSEGHRDAVRELCAHYCLQTDGSEPGAKKYRCKVVGIDKKRGTAAGYIAKYIAKNIDGYGVDADLFGRDPAASAARVDAWASTWGIRQFQQIGGASVTVWRELRRLGDGEGLAGILGDAATCADSGDWAGFVSVMGGPCAPRGDRPIRLAKRTAMDTDTGEVRMNRYGEPSADQVFGVECGSVVVQTRVHEWRIGRASKNVEWVGCGGAVDVGLVAQTNDVLNFSVGVAEAPWSPVNNCTVENDVGKIGGPAGQNSQGERCPYAGQSAACRGGGGLGSGNSCRAR